MKCVQCMQNISAFASICPYCHCSTKTSTKARSGGWGGFIIGGLLGLYFGVGVALLCAIVGYVIGFAIEAANAPTPKTRDGE